MAQSKKTCPTQSELLDFVTGRLSAAWTDRLADHLENCSACQQQLESLDAAETGIDQGDRSLLAGGLPFADESECERAVDRMAKHQDANARAERVPRKLGDYLLLEPLGEGGMGTVYRARHASLDSIAAI